MKISVLFGLVIVVLLLTVLPIHVTAQEGDEPSVTLEFSTYDGNPVLTPEAEGEWDAGFVFAGYVLFKDGLFHMLYGGGDLLSSGPSGIGYATSEDGRNWTKYDQNPVLTLPESIGRGEIGIAIPILDDETWVVYFTYGKYPGVPAGELLRATAPDPTGPWTIDETPLLESGSYSDWDRELGVVSVIKTEDNYVLYYQSFNPDAHFGRATSPDGIHWTKYDNPETTEKPFANSDPVFSPDERPAWDAGYVVSPIVTLTDLGWEMFYAGTTIGREPWKMGFATSPDGINWARVGDGSVILSDEGAFMPASCIMVDDSYYLYYEIWEESTSSLALATGTVTYE